METPDRRGGKRVGSRRSAKLRCSHRNERGTSPHNVKDVFESAKAVRVNYKNLRTFDFAPPSTAKPYLDRKNLRASSFQLSSVHESEEFGSVVR